MPTAGQPADRRGTVGHPYSALNLRLALAAFGLVSSVVLGVLLIRNDFVGFGWVVLGFGVIAAIDIVVIQRRRRARRRAGGQGYSLFE
jgi:hypothetical protein